MSIFPKIVIGIVAFFTVAIAIVVISMAASRWEEHRLAIEATQTPDNDGGAVDDE